MYTRDKYWVDVGGKLNTASIHFALKFGKYKFVHVIENLPLNLTILKWYLGEQMEKYFIPLFSNKAEAPTMNVISA